MNKNLMWCHHEGGLGFYESGNDEEIGFHTGKAGPVRLKEFYTEV